MIELFAHVKPGRAMHITLLVISTLISPYWYLLHFRPEMINGGNLATTILSCLAIGMPLFGAILLIVVMPMVDVFEKMDKRKKDSATPTNNGTYLFGGNAFTTGFTSLTFYLPCIFKFWWVISFRNSIYCMMLIFLIWFMIRMIVVWNEKDSMKAQTP